MKNDELLHLVKKLLAAISGTIERISLLVEWKRWERRSRRAWTSSERYDAMHRANELRELIFRKREEP